MQPGEVAGFEHGGNYGAGLLRHHGLPTGHVDCDQARDAVEVWSSGISDSRKGSAGGGDGGREGGGAEAGEQELLGEAVL